MKTLAPGINWIWYMADTEKEAKEYFKEVTGNELNEETHPCMICKMHDGRWGFRIHR